MRRASMTADDLKLWENRKDTSYSLDQKEVIDYSSPAAAETSPHGGSSPNAWNGAPNIVVQSSGVGMASPEPQLSGDLKTNEDFEANLVDSNEIDVSRDYEIIDRDVFQNGIEFSDEEDDNDVAGALPLFQSKIMTSTEESTHIAQLSEKLERLGVKSIYNNIDFFKKYCHPYAFRHRSVRTRYM